MPLRADLFQDRLLGTRRHDGPGPLRGAGARDEAPRRRARPASGRPVLGPRGPAHAAAWVDDRRRRAPTGRLGLTARGRVAVRRIQAIPRTIGRTTPRRMRPEPAVTPRVERVGLWAPRGSRPRIRA